VTEVNLSDAAESDRLSLPTRFRKGFSSRSQRALLLPLVLPLFIALHQRAEKLYATLKLKKMHVRRNKRLTGKTTLGPRKFNCH
jgi:energy-coupling factor transporter transmembrane protein EcfT